MTILLKIAVAAIIILIALFCTYLEITDRFKSAILVFFIGVIGTTLLILQFRDEAKEADKMCDCEYIVIKDCP